MARRLHVLSSHLKNTQNSTVASTQSNSPGKTGMANPITTHILDTALGQPARHVPVVLSFLEGSGEWQRVSAGTTDDNGRCGNFITGADFKPGTYRMYFDTASYFTSMGNSAPFYPYVEIVFNLRDTTQHYHIPLLLSTYSYTTYRGS